MFEIRSALHTYRAQPGVDGADGRRALKLGELTGTRLLQLGVYPGGAARLAAAVSPILGALPESPVRAALTGERLLLRISADQYWIVGGESHLESELATVLPAADGCITSLEGARTRLFIEGPAARAALSKLVAVDLHPDVLPIHGFAQTGIHHVGGLLLRVGEQRYEFFALRTFAATIWEVLLDAARPFGYEILLPEG